MGNGRGQSTQEQLKDAIARCDMAERKVIILESRVAAWKKAIEGLTPSGSEFVDYPEACAAFIRKRTEYPRMIIELRAQVAAMREVVEAAQLWRIEHLRAKSHMSDMLLAEDKLVAAVTALAALPKEPVS